MKGFTFQHYYFSYFCSLVDDVLHICNMSFKVSELFCVSSAKRNKYYIMLGILFLQITDIILTIQYHKLPI